MRASRIILWVSAGVEVLRERAISLDLYRSHTFCILGSLVISGEEHPGVVRVHRLPESDCGYRPIPVGGSSFRIRSISFTDV